MQTGYSTSQFRLLRSLQELRIPVVKSPERRNELFSFFFFSFTSSQFSSALRLRFIKTKQNKGLKHCDTPLDMIENMKLRNTIGM